MGKLNQVIAVAQGKKSLAERVLTEAHHKLQKAGLLEGISRTYRPKDDDGEKLPPEFKGVQVTVADVIREISRPITEWFDVAATQEWANCTAKADVVVNGRVLIESVPVAVLLFIEKRLVDLHTFASKLPTLDPAERWTADQATSHYRSNETETVRTKKVPRNHVVAEATKEHPAQVQVYTEDVPVGYWSTTRFSGAIPAQRKQDVLDRIRALQDAVKVAREQANSADVVEYHIGHTILDHLFADKAK